MDSSKSFKNKEEDTYSSSQPPLEPSYLSYLCLSPTRQPVIIDDLENLISFDERDFSFTTPGLDLSSEEQLFESDIIGDKSRIEDPYNINKLYPLSEETMMVHQENPAYVDELGELPYVEWPSDETKEQDPVNELQDYEDYIMPQPVNDLQGHKDYTPQLMPDPLQEDVNQYEDNGEMRTTLHVSAENLSSVGSESMLASPKHRDTRRRLQFEEAASSALGGNNYPLPTHIPKESESSTPSDAKGSKSSSGFGIHLNSLMKATPPVGSAEGSEIKPKSVKFRLSFSSNKEGESIVSISKLSTIEKWHEIDASVAADTVTSISMSPRLIEPLTPSPYPHVNNTTSPSDAMTKNSEKFKPPRPPAKKRPNTYDTDDLQRCNCRKSACMKLYCDCFAAKLCCTKSCTCQGCLNRPELEDKDVQGLLPITPSLQCSDESQSSVSLANVSQVTPPSIRSRIFTLHGVPSFQPKTPCIDSNVKGNATG